MMDNTLKPVKARTVIKKFKKNPWLTFEQIGEEDYNLGGEQFIEVLKKLVDDSEIKKLLKDNQKRKTKDVENENYSTKSEMEDDTMKARAVRKLDVNKKNEKPNDTSIAQIVNAGLANPRSTMENLLLVPKPSKSELNAGPKVTEVSVPESAKPEIMEISKKEEENMKQEENKKFTLEDLEVRKKAILRQIEGQETEKEFKLVIIQSTEQERDEKQNKVENLKKQLATAEEELLGTECELETLHLEIVAIDEKAEKYRKELAEVEEQIQQESIVYLMAPSYRGHPKKEGHYVASAPGKGEGVEVDPYGENLVDEMTRKEIKSKAAEYGYEDYEKFASDYAFALIVKKYHEEGANYSVKTSENALINELLNKIVGKDVWHHD